MKRTVYLIGAGVGPQGMSVRAAHIVQKSGCVVDARGEGGASTREQNWKAIVSADPETILSALRASGAETCAVLLPGSGEPQMQALCPRLQSFAVVCLPGVDASAYLAARLGIFDRKAVHLPACASAREWEQAVRTHRYAAVDTTAQISAQERCAALVQAGMGLLRASVGEHLGTAQERATTDTCAAVSHGKFARGALLVENQAPMDALARLCIPDAEFVRGAVPMTKAEVRAVTIGKLALQRDSVVYDIGCGTGSVSVEAALQAPAGRVFAIDQNREAVALTAQNRKRFAVWNVEPVLGAAPEVLTALPAPDAVFIGGSGGVLAAILRAVLAKNARARLVLNCISLDTLAQARRLLASLPVSEPEIVQVSVAKARKSGAHHLLIGQNPVFILQTVGNPEAGGDPPEKNRSEA